MTPRHRAYLRLAAERGDAAARRELIDEARARHLFRRELAGGAVLVVLLWGLAVLLLGIHP